jgi:hypothetical protein
MLTSIDGNIEGWKNGEGKKNGINYVALQGKSHCMIL